MSWKGLYPQLNINLMIEGYPDYKTPIFMDTYKEFHKQTAKGVNMAIEENPLKGVVTNFPTKGRNTNNV